MPERGTWWIAALALPVVALFAMSGRDTLGPLLYAFFFACVVVSPQRKLYAVMFVLSLVMELYGTWIGNWTWAREVPWWGLTADNPPLAAGTFYCLLDFLVVITTRRWLQPASPIWTPSIASHQAATLSARSSSR